MSAIAQVSAGLLTLAEICLLTFFFIPAAARVAKATQSVYGVYRCMHGDLESFFLIYIYIYVYLYIHIYI